VRYSNWRKGIWKHRLLGGVPRGLGTFIWKPKFIYEIIFNLFEISRVPDTKLNGARFYTPLWHSSLVKFC